MDRRLSPDGLAKLKELEGFRATPYDDGEGYLTVGYGHRLHNGDFGYIYPLGLQEAENILLADVAVAELCVTRSVLVSLTQSQFDALVIFAYNVGVGAFGESTLLRLLNDGHPEMVPHELIRWHYARGVSIPGLFKRRLAEIALWNKESK
jgi:lysozyme